MSSTAPGMALFLIAVLIITPILTALVGVLIERRYHR